MTWISFLDLLPIFFAKESLFSLSSAVGKLIHLDLTMINKTQPSFAKVKVQVNFTEKLPEYVELEV